jgi:hypothetical protein
MNFAPANFGLRPSSGSLYWVWLKLYIYVLKDYVVMGGACSAYGGEERCVQGFGGETWGKETTGETQA